MTRSTVNVKIRTRPTRRLRLKRWWARLRMPREQRELVDAYERHLEELALYGTRPPHRIVLHDEELGDA